MENHRRWSEIGYGFQVRAAHPPQILWGVPPGRKLNLVLEKITITFFFDHSEDLEDLEE